MASQNIDSIGAALSCRSAINVKIKGARYKRLAEIKFLSKLLIIFDCRYYSITLNHDAAVPKSP